MAGKTVAGELYYELDGQLLEIKPQLRQPNGNRNVAYLDWGGERWFLDFLWLAGDFDSDDRFLRSCKPD